MTKEETAGEAPPPEWRVTRAPEKRDVWRAMARGVAGRCPACGEGTLFYKYLKVNPACPVCDEDLSHHRADDAPPYVVITIVGHVILFGVMLTEAHVERPDYLRQMLIWPPLALALSLALLPPVKGALIALQWALRMHGFGEPAPGERDP